MTHLILQPASDDSSQRNLQKTVFGSVDTNTFAGLIDSRSANAIRALHGDATHLWGAKPGEDGRNVKRWDRIVPGDVVFFALGKGRAALARVTYKFRSEALATRLWGTTETQNGFVQTWELAFALDSIRRLAYDKAVFNFSLGRQANADIREFVVLSDEKSAGALAYLEIPESSASPAYPENRSTSSKLTVAGIVDSLEALDRATVSRARLEQRLLRQYLLDGESGTCALCGRQFPVQFLVAAHIKRRADCTDSEKRDIQNIAIPACKLGCDELFERRMIAVDADGVIRALPHAPETGEVRLYIDANLAGRRVHDWERRLSSHKYFASHFSEATAGSQA